MKIHVRQIKYLNNVIEQDHCGIKCITKPMMGFKAFHSADATLSGIELCRMLKKGQHVNSENSQTFEQFYALSRKLHPGKIYLQFYYAIEKFATEPFLLFISLYVSIFGGYCYSMILRVL